MHGDVRETFVKAFEKINLIIINLIKKQMQYPVTVNNRNKGYTFRKEMSPLANRGT